MVLIPTGESDVEVQVNGTTEGNFSQRVDSTYDVNVSASANGSTYTITSANNVFVGSDNSQRYTLTNIPNIGESFDYSVTTECPDRTAIVVNGTTVSDFSYNGNSASGSLSSGSNFDLAVDTAGTPSDFADVFADWSVTFSDTQNATLSVSGVNKS
jgi:hypothetical protein